MVRLFGANKESKEVAFAVGTGRSGTKFVYTLLGQEKKVASYHERHPSVDTFHRYFKWYNLPIDSNGFVENKRQGIEVDLEKNSLSFESSAFLSMSVKELYNAFDAKFVLMVRNPEHVVNSYIKKGWYEHLPENYDGQLPPSYFEHDLFHHFLGRTLPQGEEYQRWKKLTQVGKLAWFWKALNQRVLDQFDELEPSNKLIVRLEDFGYEYYKNTLTPFLGVKSKLSKRAFEKISLAKPNSFKNVKTKADWSELERNEFEIELGDFPSKLGY